MASEHIEEVGLRFKADGSADYIGTLKQINNEMSLTYAEYVRDTAEMDKNATATEKLKAKKKMLESQMDSQRQKVAVLRQQVEEMSKSEDANTDALQKKQKELAYAEAKLTSYGKSIEDVNDELSKHTELTDKMSSKLGEVGGKVEDIGKKASVVSAGIVAAGTASVKASADFQESMNKVNTLDLNASEGKINGLKENILSLSSETGVAATEIAEATYAMGSALGELKDNTVDYVEVATKAAIGGFSDTETAINGLSTVMNTYGMTTAEEMAKVSDQMLMAQNLGKTTFGEIAQSVGNVIPIFKQAGGSTEELFGAYAILTKNGIATSQATTGLKAALSNVVKPTADAAKVAQELGIDFSMTHMQNVGFAQFINEIGVACGGNVEKMSKLFGSTEALNSMLVLTSTEGMEQFNGAVAAMNDATGATEAAFEKMNGGMNTQLEILQTSIQNIGIQIGEILLPLVNPLIELMQNAASWIANLDDGTKKMIVTVAAIAAAIGPLLIVLGKVISSVGSLIGAVPQIISGFSKVGSAFSGFVGLIAAHPIVAAIAAVIAIIATLWTKCEWFRNLVKSLFEWLMSMTSKVSDWVVAAFQTISDALTALHKSASSTIDKMTTVFKTIVEFLKKAFVQGWTAAFKTISGIVEALFSTISSVWTNIKAIFTGIIDFVKNVFTGNWRAAWQNVVDVFGNVFSMIGNLVKAPINAVITLLNSAIDGINAIAIEMPNWVPGVGGKRLGFNIPNIPMLASGGELISGMAIVAEAGPELVTQVGGRTVVTPLSGTSKNSGQISLSNETIERLASMIAQLLAAMNISINIGEREFARIIREVMA